MANRKVVFIAGGGTGGHIYPGVAIARALQKLDSNVDVHFVGTALGLETQLIPREGFELHLVVGGALNFQGNRIKKLLTWAKMPWAFLQSMALLLKYRPIAVLGVGGYASGPFVLTASLLGFPTAIWEPNARPGKANRWLSRFVDRSFLVFEQSAQFLKSKSVSVHGMPVRDELQTHIETLRPPGPLRILCFCGSQGSQKINEVLSQALLADSFRERTRHWEVIHQIGRRDWQQYQNKYESLKGRVTSVEFIFDMPQKYQWADLLVCRGGMSTLSEAAGFGVPPVVIPLPAADDHQGDNARALVEVGAAVMIPQRELTPERLVAEIEALEQNREQREKMKKNLKTWYRKQGAEQIAQALLDESV